MWMSRAFQDILHAPFRQKKLQKKLLKSAYQALKPSGELIYSTCTLNREENEEFLTNDILVVEVTIALSKLRLLLIHQL